MGVKKAIDVLQRATAKCTEGDRHLVVLDRGWIFAGDLSREGDVYTLTNAVNVRKWSEGGFGALSQSAKSAKATLDPCAPLRFDKSALIMVVPISEKWHG